MENFTWYCAGPWADRPFVREIIAKIQADGWKTCSRWADSLDIPPDATDRQEQLRQRAARDIEDVVQSDGLIYVNSSISEGKSTELGLSIALLKPIIIIGERSYADRGNNNIFLNLNFPCYPTIEDALEWLKGDGQFYLEWVQERQLDHIEKTLAAFEMADDVEFPSE